MDEDETWVNEDIYSAINQAKNALDNAYGDPKMLDILDDVLDYLALHTDFTFDRQKD